MATDRTFTASVVILSHKDNELISEAFSRLAAQFNSELELILLSNGNDELTRRAKTHFSEFQTITTPFVVGCSMGRNIGARLARGKWLIFLDDDGLIEDGCVESLLRCAKETGAPMVRGRIKPLTLDMAEAPSNYDLGDYRRLSFLNGEGVSCVLKRDLLRFDGFDPVLAGHEGVELCARMWRFYGPLGFVYEPSAVLLHDYSKGDAHLEQKKKRYAALKQYVEEVTPNCFLLHDMLRNQAYLPEASAALAVIDREANRHSAAGGGKKITVVTTVKNGRDWLDDYELTWAHQDYDNYEVVIVDDGSTDDTLEKIREIAERDTRFVVVEGSGEGRSAALNAAIGAGTGDIFVIADVDDVSVPNRLSLTMKYFEAFPDCDVVSFATYGEDSLASIGGRPKEKNFYDLKTRLLVGMAGRFPSYAFRRRFFQEPFDNKLVAGVDYDWVSRNIAANSAATGHVLPIPIVYYRQHDGSISTQRVKAQSDTRKAIIKRNFDNLIESMSERDIVFIEAVSSNFQQFQEEDLRAYRGWINKLIGRNAEVGAYDPEALAFALLNFLRSEGVSEATKIVSTPDLAYKFSETVFQSVQYFEDSGDFRKARALLRSFRKGAKGLSGKKRKYMLWSLKQKTRKIFVR
ncbi:glycosyl transferase, group 2 family [Rhodobacteraceae bacterium KLH11]|nr:glycosyl transferase, group 2 family [Rhodobacteraceae bacterium KLH11]